MPRPTETASFKFCNTTFRIKDPKPSLEFYTKILGMELIGQQPMGALTLYFLAFEHTEGLTAAEKDATKFSREGVLSLRHEHGTESDANFKGYTSGNEEPGKGFGHIAVTVDDVEKACERFEKLGVRFKKRPSEGKMRHIAFILDPDGYWIEIVPYSLKL